MVTLRKKGRKKEERTENKNKERNIELEGTKERKQASEE